MNELALEVRPAVSIVSMQAIQNNERLRTLLVAVVRLEFIAEPRPAMVALIPLVRYFGASTSEPVLHVWAALSHVLPRVASKRVEELSSRHDGVHALVMNLWIVRLRIAFKGWHTALLERQIESGELRSGVREHLVERGILEHGAEPLVVVGSALCERQEAIDAQCHLQQIAT